MRPNESNKIIFIYECILVIICVGECGERQKTYFYRETKFYIPGFIKDCLRNMESRQLVVAHTEWLFQISEIFVKYFILIVYM